MLEKNDKNIQKFCDAHFHQYDCAMQNCNDYPENWYGASCTLSIEEWNFITKNPIEKCCYTFGVHPQFVNKINQNTIKEYLTFLESLCKNQSEVKLSAVGEIGYDFYTDEYKNQKNLQEEIFYQQVEIALKYNKPVVIHCRKANEKIFEAARILKKLPAVLFHSYMGTYKEALSIISKDINAYFSFGKQILNNNKKVVDCVSNLPLSRLLLETDAPYQYLKGECKTDLNDIKKIYAEAKKLRKENMTDVEFSNILFENLLYLYHGSE